MNKKSHHDVKIAIICRFDSVSNGKKAHKTKEVLQENGFDAEIIDSPILDLSKLPLLKKIFSFVYWFYHVKRIFFNLKLLRDYPIFEEMELRSKIMYGKIKNRFNIVICQIAEESNIFTYRLPILKIYDMPTPWVEELKYGQMYSPTYIQKLQIFEKKILSCSDWVTYAWQTYVMYAKKYINSNARYFICNWGSESRKRKAEYVSPPKIVFVGFIGNYWANISLLSSLSKISQYQIDVYGIPEPPKEYNLHYKGPLVDETVLHKYQFGLVTISKDRLRKHGWSFKQMDYISSGLPILMPEWRKDKIFEGASVYYNEFNFNKKIKEYSKKAKWTIKHKKAMQLATKYKWKDTLLPLIKIISLHERQMIHNMNI